MITWKRGFLLIFIVLTSTWISYIYLTTNSSPLFVWSEWVTAIERSDISTIERFSEWNGQSINTAQAKSIIETLHRYPDWKQRIYHELQKQAVKLVHKQSGEDTSEQQPWFHLTRKVGTSSYKVKVPSFYFSVAGIQSSLLLSIDQQLFSVADQSVGPFMATDTNVQLIYQNKIGDIQESYTLDLSELWGEEEIQILPTSVFSSFIVQSTYTGGDLFIDDHYAGEIRGPTRIERLSYERHQLRLERSLPWGVIHSERIYVEPDQKEVNIPITLVNDTLIEQLGEALVQYNLGWSAAARSGDPKKLVLVTPELRHQMSKMIHNQIENAHFAGDFIQILLDPNSIELNEPMYQHFEVKLVCREDYAAGRWESENGEYLLSYEPQRYWEYQLIYTSETGWQVVGFSELNQKQENVRDWRAYHAQRVLRIGIDAGLPPFESIENGELYGFDVELMQWLGEKMNVTILFQERPWNQIVDQFDVEGDLDGAISAVDQSLAQKIKNVRITYPYYVDEADPQKKYVIILRQDLAQLYEKMNQLIKELQSEYTHEYDEMKKRYF